MAGGYICDLCRRFYRSRSMMQVHFEETHGHELAQALADWDAEAKAQREEA